MESLGPMGDTGWLGNLLKINDSVLNWISLSDILSPAGPKDSIGAGGVSARAMEGVVFERFRHKFNLMISPNTIEQHLLKDFSIKQSQSDSF